MKNIHLKLRIIFPLLVLLLSNNASAATFYDCIGPFKAKWMSTATMHVDESYTDFGHPSMSAQLYRLQQAVLSWSDLPGSTFTTTTVADDSTQGYGNGQSEIYINDYIDGDNGSTDDFDVGTLAVTHHIFESEYILQGNFQHTGVCLFDDVAIIEADIIVNSAELDPIAGIDLYIPQAFERMINHEMGHVAGLRHENDSVGMMMSQAPFGGDTGNTFIIEPLGDDRKGMRSLYWDQDYTRDLAATRWKCCDTYFPGGPPGKSVKRINVQIDSNTHQDVFVDLYRGQAYRIPWMVHNLGSQDEDIQVRISLGQYCCIPSSDTILGDDMIGLLEPRGWAQGRKRVVIPTDMDPGLYFLKWEVDFNDNISEDVETNNKARRDIRYRVH